MTTVLSDAAEVLERIQAHLWLVDAIVRQMSRAMHGAVDLDDLRSAGREGLLDAARRYDPSYATPFRAYANYRVRGAIVDHLRKNSSLPRRAYERLVAIEAAAHASEGHVRRGFAEPVGGLEPADAEDVLDEHLGVMVAAATIRAQVEAARPEAHAPGPEDPEAAYAKAELMALVHGELERLEWDEAEVVRRHYLQDHKLEDIAADLGVSVSWVSRLHKRAIARLGVCVSRAGGLPQRD